MEKTFNSLNELLEFDFGQLEPQKSNYLKLIPADGILPKISKDFQQNWRMIRKSDCITSTIIIEITPRWISINIHIPGEYTQKNEFEITPNMNPKDLLKQIFDSKRSGGEFLTGLLLN